MAISHVADLLSSQHNDQCNFLSNRKKKSYRDFQLFHAPLLYFLLTQNSRERQPFSSQFFETLIIIFQTGNTKKKKYICVYFLLPHCYGNSFDFPDYNNTVESDFNENFVDRFNTKMAKMMAQ